MTTFKKEIPGYTASCGRSVMSSTVLKCSKCRTPGEEAELGKTFCLCCFYIREHTRVILSVDTKDPA